MDTHREEVCTLDLRGWGSGQRRPTAWAGGDGERYGDGGGAKCVEYMS